MYRFKWSSQWSGSLMISITIVAASTSCKGWYFSAAWIFKPSCPALQSFLQLKSKITMYSQERGWRRTVHHKRPMKLIPLQWESHQPWWTGDESYRWSPIDLHIQFKLITFSVRNRKTDPANRLKLHENWEWWRASQQSLVRRWDLKFLSSEIRRQ